MKRFVIQGGEAELARLLDQYAGVEEVDAGWAVYGEEPPIGFELASAEEVEPGWEDAWRAFHHGVRVGRCWVGPPWEQPPADAIPVVIDPGRAFGTGAHPTTRLALELLQELEPTSLLDAGCGSGVLAIAAAKLGFGPVGAFDVDEVALEVTRLNAVVNGVEVDVLEHARPAELAVMNIALDVVEELLPELPVERAITSGYLDTDEPAVAGWQCVGRRERDGWAADLLEFRP